MTTRLQVLNAFAALLADVRIANGYTTDAGQLVALGAVEELGPDDPDAALAIAPGDDRRKGGAGTIGTDLVEWTIEFLALVKADIDQPWVAIENAVGDIRKALETDDRLLGGLLKSDLQRGSTRVVLRQPGSTIVGASVTYVATIAQTWGVL